MTIPLTMPLPTQLQPPTRTCWSIRGSADLPEDRCGTRSLFGVAPSGACHAAAVASRAVGSYPTVSPLPATDPKRTLEEAGGLFSVALSVGLPRPGVTRHRFLLESGLSSPLPEDNKAAIQPSAQDVAYAAARHAVNEDIHLEYVAVAVRDQSRPGAEDLCATVRGADGLYAKACQNPPEP